MVWGTGDHSFVSHNAGFVGAVEVQDVLVASDFMLDLGDVVVFQYFQDPFMRLFLGVAWEDFTGTPVNMWDIKVATQDDYSIRVVSSYQVDVGEGLFKFVEGFLAFIWWAIEGTKVNLTDVMRRPWYCYVPAPDNPTGIRTWTDSPLRVTSQRSNQLGQRVRPAGEKLAGRLDCHIPPFLNGTRHPCLATRHSHQAREKLIISRLWWTINWLSFTQACGRAPNVMSRHQTTPLVFEPGLIAHSESRASALTNSAKGSDPLARS